MKALLTRIASLFRRDRLDAQLDDEVQFHIDMLAREHMRRGMREADARAAALRRFGGVIQMKESYRDQRGLPFLETFVQDARYGARSLRRTPAFTLAAVVTLALGMGATSAIFSVVNAVLLKPLPYPEPERIVQMFRNAGGGLQEGLDARRFQFFQEQMRSFEAFAAWRQTAFNVTAGDSAEYLPVLQVSKEYFAVFAGTPLHGRTFHPAEDVPNGPDVVVLQHRLWRRLFASNPAVLGTRVSLGERPYTIVGIMPAGFDAMRSAELYVPLRPSPTGPGSGFNYQVAGRLRPGVTRQQANAEAGVVFESYRASATSSRASSTSDEGPPQFLPCQESLSRSVRPALLMLLGAVGMLLLIACANTANLLLARASGRGREISVRAALGAGRLRIIRQLITESTLLFLAGGLLGMALAYWSVPALLAMTPDGYLPAREVRVDGTVLLVALGMSLLTGVVFGLAPALSLSRDDLVEAFKEDGTRTTSGRRSNWLRGGLVVAEVALCLLLLVGAGLLIQTFLKLRAVDLGFDPANVVTARMSLIGERYATSEAVNRFYDRGLERIRQLPGVQAAAVVSGIPIDTGLNLNFDRLDTTEVETHLTDWRYATPGYLGMMGIEIVQGRGLTERDGTGAPRVAVVSQEFAKRYYGETQPIGRQISVFSKDGPIEIVGIARNVREAGLSGPVPAVMYVPVAQAGDAAVKTAHMYFQVSWVVRASSISSELAQRIREELRAIDPMQPITAFRSIDEVKARAMAIETFQMTLLAIFAGIGLVLAVAGIYGLMAYSVAQRTRELGIRMALGATRRRILASVLRQGAGLAISGIAVGVVAAIGLTRTLQSFVFGVSTLDLSTFVGVAVILLVVALLATLLPAFRAVRLNPVAALRE
jgi:predicted permease